MATVTRTTIFADGNVLTAAQLNNEFNNLLNAVAITNSDISAGAAISTSKINATFPVGAIVGTTDTQTLTHKTLQSPVSTLVADSDGATINFDLSAGQIHSVTLGGNRTLTVSNATVGQVFMIRLIQGTGGQTVTWFSEIEWTNNNTTPTLTVTAGNWDTFGFICTASGVYDGYIVGTNLG